MTTTRCGSPTSRRAAPLVAEGFLDFGYLGVVAYAGAWRRWSRASRDLGRARGVRRPSQAMPCTWPSSSSSCCAARPDDRRGLRLAVRYCLRGSVALIGLTAARPRRVMRRNQAGGKSASSSSLRHRGAAPDGRVTRVPDLLLAALRARSSRPARRHRPASRRSASMQIARRWRARQPAVDGLPPTACSSTRLRAVPAGRACAAWWRGLAQPSAPGGAAGLPPRRYWAMLAACCAANAARDVLRQHGPRQPASRHGAALLRRRRQTPASSPAAGLLRLRHCAAATYHGRARRCRRRRCSNPPGRGAGARLRADSRAAPGQLDNLAQPWRTASCQACTSKPAGAGREPGHPAGRLPPRCGPALPAAPAWCLSGCRARARGAAGPGADAGAWRARGCAFTGAMDAAGAVRGIRRGHLPGAAQPARATGPGGQRSPAPRLPGAFGERSVRVPARNCFAGRSRPGRFRQRRGGAGRHYSERLRARRRRPAANATSQRVTMHARQGRHHGLRQLLAGARRRGATSLRGPRCRRRCTASPSSTAPACSGRVEARSRPVRVFDSAPAREMEPAAYRRGAGAAGTALPARWRARRLATGLFSWVVRRPRAAERFNRHLAVAPERAPAVPMPAATSPPACAGHSAQLAWRFNAARPPRDECWSELYGELAAVQRGALKRAGAVNAAFLPRAASRRRRQRNHRRRAAAPPGLPLNITTERRASGLYHLELGDALRAAITGAGLRGQTGGADITTSAGRGPGRAAWCRSARVRCAADQGRRYFAGTRPARVPHFLRQRGRAGGGAQACRQRAVLANATWLPGRDERLAGNGAVLHNTCRRKKPWHGPAACVQAWQAEGAAAWRKERGAPRLAACLRPAPARTCAAPRGLVAELCGDGAADARRHRCRR